MILLVYAFAAAGLFYLGCQATITRPVWSRFPDWLYEGACCPACSGFWYGLGLGWLGWWGRIPFPGFEPRSMAAPFAVAVCSIAWTPMVAALSAWGLGFVHEVIRLSAEEHATGATHGKTS